MFGGRYRRTTISRRSGGLPGRPLGTSSGRWARIYLTTSRRSRSAAPQTFCRYTGSHKGVVYGYEHDVWDSVIARALSLPLEGYVKGLEFVGGHGLLVQGYSAAISTGRLAALAVLGKMKRKSGREVIGRSVAQ